MTFMFAMDQFGGRSVSSGQPGARLNLAICTRFTLIFGSFCVGLNIWVFVGVVELVVVIPFVNNI